MNQQLIQILLKAKDEASATIAGVGQSLDTLGGKTASFVSQNKAAAGTLSAGLLTVMGLVTGQALSQASAYQQNRVAFETMLGSADAARILLKQLSDFAARTPFQLPDVVQGAKNLLAFGDSAADIIPDFSLLGNIAAAVGTDKLPALVNVFGQVRTAGRLMSQDLLQFTSAGVPIIDELATHFGITKDKVRDLVAEGKVGFEDVRAALSQLGGPTGRWGGLMAKQSLTFGGTLSNVSDQMGRLLRQAAGIGPDGDIRKGSLFDIATKGATALLAALNRAMPTIEHVIGFFEKNRAAVVGLVGAIGGLVALVGFAFISAFGGAIVLMGAFALAGAAIAVVAFEIITHWTQIKNFFVGLWKTVTDAFHDAYIVMRMVFDLLTGGDPTLPAEKASGAWLLFAIVLSSIRDAAIDVINAIKSIYDIAVKPVVDLFVADLRFLYGVFNYIFELMRAVAEIVFGLIYSAYIKPMVDSSVAVFQFLAGIVIGIWNSIAGWAQNKFDAIRGTATGTANSMMAVWRPIASFFSGLWNAVSDAATSAWNAIAGRITGSMNSAKNSFAGVINYMIDALNKVISLVNNTVGRLPGVRDIGQIQHFATGVSDFGGGWAMVGDVFGSDSGEMVKLPKGATVYNNSDSRDLLKGNGGSTINVVQNINSQVDYDLAWRELGWSLANA